MSELFLGIVGHEAAKFTKTGEAKAREEIRKLLTPNVVVVSGACHLGGIDIWAVEEAKKLGLRFIEYRPKNLEWSTGYKPRNLQIAKQSHHMFCIVVNTLPDDYTGMRFNTCYHCHRNDHIKSGGCWTGKQAEKLGKPFDVIIIDQEVD